MDGRSGLSLPGLASSAWCTVFGFVHIYWALGGRIGLPSDLRLPDHPYLFAADLAAIPLCFGFAWLTAGFGRSGQPFRRPAIAGAAIFCLVHALPPLAGHAWRMFVAADPVTLTQREQLAIFVYEPYWFLGGLLLLSTVIASGRKPEGVAVPPLRT